MLLQVGERLLEDVLPRLTYMHRNDAIGVFNQRREVIKFRSDLAERLAEQGVSIRSKLILNVHTVDVVHRDL